LGAPAKTEGGTTIERVFAADLLQVQRRDRGRSRQSCTDRPVEPGAKPFLAAGLADCGDQAHFYRRLLEEGLLTIVLDHTIVPARDKEESARFFARIFGLEYQGPVSHFAPVRINETLTIDFDNWDSFERHHYAFKVSEAEFDGIFDRVRGEGLTYGSGPRSAENMEINHRNGGRGFYFRDPNGHLLEVLTA
jgi:catechol 2,3-dioxygenase-like lactoylglutathione lyase family enzyme